MNAPSMHSQKSFTIAELLVATGFILLTSLAILFSYVQCLELNRINEDTLTALENARSTMETVKATAFDQIHDTYDHKTFTLRGLEQGIGLVEVDNKNPQLLGVTVKVFWKTKNRVVGEDTNLNGTLDDGEDANDNGKLDAQVNLLTYIVKR